MQVKLDTANPFNSARTTYASVGSAERATAKKLEQMSGYPRVVATIVVTPVGDRFGAVVIFQGTEAQQAAIHAVHFGVKARCFA
jgi:hypothetical protein